MVEFISSFDIEKDDKDLLFTVIMKYKKTNDLSTLVGYLKLKKEVVEILQKFALET